MTQDEARAWVENRISCAFRNRYNKMMDRVRQYDTAIGTTCDERSKALLEAFRQIEYVSWHVQFKHPKKRRRRNPATSTG
jgi:hypothetical protein